MARRQLLGLGYTSREIERRIEAGLLHPLHRGVYAVGHRKLTQRGRWTAAVLALGPGAVLSHRDAAILHDLRRIGTRAEVHVTAPGGSRPCRPGIQVHSCRRLHPDDTTVLHGIPVTSPERTLLDYAETAPGQELAWAFEAYDRLDLLDTYKLDALLARSPGRHGARALGGVIARHRGAPDTRSGNERRFLALIREAGLPVPSTNVLVAGVLVDFYWPSHGLVVEVDGYRFHHTPADRAADRHKQRTLRAAGCTVLRVSDEELGEPALADARAILSDGAGQAGR